MFNSNQTKETSQLTKKLSYTLYSNLAVLSEHRNDWCEAARLWKLAAQRAKRKDNNRWATLRAEFCLFKSKQTK
ncbi:ANR family transcriptional regulator [Enterobacteriaceae bacterium BIT-l23]|uniref:ANR family transcriptional regulator n=1 Tax=Jejubacter sp. L23 TaxID=3092086 RepID=UPI001585792C|nr:ANR family transcriptional regulator [Enterobacteriaceae bacterium BIT-l23]